MPALHALLDDAKREKPDFNESSSPFATRGTDSVNDSDPFGKMPGELRDLVVGSLGSKDIANLRLASRSFRQLPISLWYDLILKEMPWLWEAWTDLPYSFWACTTMERLKARDSTSGSRSQSVGFAPQTATHLKRPQTDWHWLYRQIKREWINIKGLRNRERIWKTQEYVVRRIMDTDREESFAEAYADNEDGWPMQSVI